MNTMSKAAIAVRLSALLSCSGTALPLAFFMASPVQGQPITNVQALINQVAVGDPALREITDGPKGIAAADFDLDGKTDLAVGTTDGSVTVLFGRGNGRMAAPIYLRPQ